MKPKLTKKKFKALIKLIKDEYKPLEDSPFYTGKRRGEAMKPKKRKKSLVIKDLWGIAITELTYDTSGLYIHFPFNKFIGKKVRITVEEL